jgi:unsaturated rhamnogalacturonyl hydrolase
MSRFFILLLGGILITLSVNLKGSNPKRVIENVVGYILENNKYAFINTETGEIFTSVDQLQSPENINILSRYNGWKYSHGVLNMAMLDLYEYSGDEKYKNFVLSNYEFAFDNVDFFKKHYKGKRNKWNYPYGQMFIIKELDDCGAIGAGLIETYHLDPQKRYMEHIEISADHIMNKQLRLKDGTLARPRPVKNTVWGDDLYMSVPFLARMGDLTGEMKYFDEAAKQVILFHKHLYNPKTELYYHNWYSDTEKNGVAHWGRCNGWIIMAKVNLLEYLPEDHPKRDSVIDLLHLQILGLSRHQDQTGMWHQIINRDDSYLESSSTAMFTYCIAKAVNEGWIDKRYKSVAEEGWDGLETKIQADGQVQNICMGTGIQDNLKFYYERPIILNDFHGLGAVIFAGVEMIKLIN